MSRSRSRSRSSSRSPLPDDVEVIEVQINLDERLKDTLVSDLSTICEVPQSMARSMLETHKWNIQTAIDTFLEDSRREETIDDDISKAVGDSNSNQQVGSELKATYLPDLPTETSVRSHGTPKASQGSYSKRAPELLSILSWNLDGLDDKNLEKRTDAVIKLVRSENHDILFFQELIPTTFDYIARRLSPEYFPIAGTTNPKCSYLVATFLRDNYVFYQNHDVIPFPNTSMERTLLITKAFIGKAKLCLLNTHLESTAEFADERKAQLKFCFEQCTSLPPEYNVIFGGDLNLRDKEVTGILPPNMVDLWIECGSRKDCRFTWDLTRNTNKQMPSQYQPRCRFDRLYFRHSVPHRLTPEFFGVTGIERVAGTQAFPSDHWGIISFFRLTDEAREPEETTGATTSTSLT